MDSKKKAKSQGMRSFKFSRPDSRKKKNPALPYPMPSFGTVAARKARRLVSRMSQEQQDTLYELALDIAHGRPAPAKLPEPRHQPVR